MHVFSYRTAGQWLEARPAADDQKPTDQGDSAQEEIRRLLSDVLRCGNLVVLTGLGTSLHVNLDRAATDSSKKRIPLEGKKLAPTMWNLWEDAEKKSGAAFKDVLRLSKLPTAEQEKGNIEALLSYCKSAGEFVDDAKEKGVIATFIRETEDIRSGSCNS